MLAKYSLYDALHKQELKNEMEKKIRQVLALSDQNVPQRNLQHLLRAAVSLRQQSCPLMAL